MQITPIDGKCFRNKIINILKPFLKTGVVLWNLKYLNFNINNHIIYNILSYGNYRKISKRIKRFN